MSAAGSGVSIGVKVCGLCRPADAAAAVAAGATHLGVILSARGPRALDGAAARTVLAERAGARAAGVFVDEPTARVAELVSRLQLDVVQLHGEERTEQARQVREATGAAVWKAVRVRDAASARAAIASWASHVDGILLDGWSPRGAGGTGTSFQWAALRDIRTLLPDHVTLVVAGGLHAGNVADAIMALSPDVVDSSSGVEERPGVKSHEKMRAFVAATRAQRKEVGSR